jgi:diadenosine tetraphosphate (Ap4A) HIT family hydrolase
MDTITEDCIFCITDPKTGSSGIEPDRILHEYKYWWLVLQTRNKRLKTKESAGMLIAKKHIKEVSDALSEEAIELIQVIKDASKRLCVATGTAYTNQETVGYNQGKDAGQTIMHAHVHILPVAESDPIQLKIRGGIGGAFEALRKSKLG